MNDLQIRAMQDRLASMQLAIDQLQRNQMSGVAIFYAAQYEMSLTPPAGVTDQYGWYIRMNDLLIYWFAVSAAVSEGTGTMSLQAPFELDVILGSGWEMYDGSNVARGFVRLNGGGTDELFFAYPATHPSGAEVLISHTAPFTLNTDMGPSGFVVAKIYTGRVAP